MRALRTAFLLVLALLLTTTPVLAGDDALGLDEVRALLVGNTIHGIGEASGGPLSMSAYSHKRTFAHPATSVGSIPLDCCFSS